MTPEEIILEACREKPRKGKAKCRWDKCRQEMIIDGMRVTKTEFIRWIKACLREMSGEDEMQLLLQFQEVL